MRLRIADFGLRISNGPGAPLFAGRAAIFAARPAKGGNALACNPQSAIRNPQSGSILLLVLWLTAALSFVALSVGLAARTELSATRYRLEAEQARFLARGALEQAFFAMKSGLPGADGKALFDLEKSYVQFAFQTGEARVTIRPEGGLLNVNGAAPEQLRALLLAAGADEREAAEIAQAIVEWRTPRASDVPTALDRYYAALAPPYRAAHSAFTRLEELLLVKGMTRELFYGVMEWEGGNQVGGLVPKGRVVKRGGLNRLLTAAPAFGAPSLNDSPYEVLLTAPDMRPEQARAIVAGRRQGRYQRLSDLPVTLAEKTAQNVTLFGNYNVVRLEATAAARGSSTLATIRAVYARDAVAAGFYRLVGWEEQATGEEAFEQLSAVSYQLSAVSYQRSAVSYQLPAH